MSNEVKLTPEQSAAIDMWAQKLLVMGPQDFTPAMTLWVGEYAKAARAAYPDLPEDKIEDAAKRFGNLILRRFNELKSTAGGEGHA